MPKGHVARAEILPDFGILVAMWTVYPCPLGMYTPC